MHKAAFQQAAPSIWKNIKKEKRKGRAKRKNIEKNQYTRGIIKILEGKS